MTCGDILEIVNIKKMFEEQVTFVLWPRDWRRVGIATNVEDRIRILLRHFINGVFKKREIIHELSFPSSCMGVNIYMNVHLITWSV